MSWSPEISKGNKNSNDPSVIQLGFNISVAGKSESDFEIYVNNEKQACGQLSAPKLEQMCLPIDQANQVMVSESKSDKFTAETYPDKLSGPEDIKAGADHLKNERNSLSLETEDKMSRNEDLTIVDEIKSAMGNFEKFSEHVREIPRLSAKKIYTSTPYPDKNNSRSEGNLSLYGNAPRSYVPKHDFRDRKYFRKPKNLSSDLFLKPLPAEDYFKKAFVRRYYDVESYHHYSSVDSLPQCYEYGGEYKAAGKSTAKSDVDKSDALSSASEVCMSESKTSKKGDGSEINDKQSTSSESTKDIKIYQSGGIIIMQNFNENTDLIEKKDFVDSTKLIEQCSKLADKVENSLHSSDESQRLLLNSSSDEVKGQVGKFVQFDLSSCKDTRPKSCDSSAEMPKSDYIQTFKNESYETKTDFSKTKDNPLSAPQNQDFASLSTQENDSIISNLLGMSPTSSTSGKKLEWDSGADVGYLNLDLTKENISTIERIILKGLSNDGVSKKQVVYQKTEEEPGPRPSKFVLERMPSELEMGGMIQLQENDSIIRRKGLNENSSASKTTKSSTGSSQSDNGVFLDSKKWQNLKGNNKSEETPQIPWEGKSSKARCHSKSSQSAENCKTKKSSDSEKLLESEQEGIVSGATSASDLQKFVQAQKNTEKFEENPTYSDKSTYVNTLYSDFCFELPLDHISRSEESGRSESSINHRPFSCESSRMKKYKKRKSNTQESNPTRKLKDKINTIINIARQSQKCDDKSKPLSSNTTIKSSEHMNLCPITDELGSQRTKIAKPVTVKSDPPSLCSLQKSISSNLNEKSVGSRPISASSSSERTVKPNIEIPKENTGISCSVKNFSDQTVQTNELLYDSKGIQAFQSAKCSSASSGIEEISGRNINEISGVPEVKNVGTYLLFSCSKSIQAPGLNSSLPKYLSHPKQTDTMDQLNTKSTQFFGGSITSLPNYHSNAIGKDTGKFAKSQGKDSSNGISRVKIENTKNTSTKKALEREIMRESVLNREGNSITRDILDAKHKTSNKELKKNKDDSEDKENFSLDEEELTDNSKKFSEQSRKESKESYNPINGSKKSDSIIFGSCDVQPSDDGKNVFLTSELLKEHGDSIDRNIIQEKYFQSQLLELGGRPMVSRSTSMEKQRESERTTQTSFSLKTGISVSCQYSSTVVTKSDEMVPYTETETGSRKEEIQPKNVRLGVDSMCNTKKDENQTPGSSSEDKDFLLADSLSSSTQTAHSWVPGVQQSCENQHLAVRRTLSFEYLPGQLYEKSENLNGDSHTATKQSVNFGDSVESEGDSTPGSNVQVKESESGHTIVLENTENTYRSHHGSDQMKNLDNNLTELEMVVNRLHEKEAIFQKITDSMLSTVSKANGSGDSIHPSGGERLSNNNSQITEQISCEIEFSEESSKSNGSNPEASTKNVGTKEISTACQTDAIETDSAQLYEEKKKLELKMNDEKEQQIKWIENEIQHLNMLRSLLEKQEDLKNSTQRKKRHYYLTEAKEGLSAVGSLNKEMVQNILRGSLPKTLASIPDRRVEEEMKLKTSAPLKLTEDSAESVKAMSHDAKSYAHLGMSLSLGRTNNVQEITMLPVGVQVTLRNRKTSPRRESPSKKISDSIDLEDKSSQNPTVASLDFIRQIDVGVQHPSLNNRLSGSNLSLTSSDLKRCRCFRCNKSKCICLKSESMDRRKSTQSRMQEEKRYEQNSAKLAGTSSTSTSGEFSKSDVKIPEIRDINNSGGVSTVETSTPHVSNSRDSSKQERSCILSSEGSIPIEKCMCLCHAEPLPRCTSCNLLNTCKKCQCYKRIRCCVCKITASRGSLQRKCATVSSSCLCNTDFCEKCRCSRVKNQSCSLCPCHAELSLETACKCIKKYEERSCQTDGKECKCCKCNEKPKEERDYYRETKYMAEEQHLTENREPTELVCPSEQKYETEARKPVEEKFPFQMKVPLEKKTCAELKNATQMKNEVEKRCACEMQPLGVKELKGKIRCRCQSRSASRKSVEDHPRHYFLQVEETTEEESSESDDNRNSLEVITIKVPIRKFSKANRNPNSSPQRNLRKLTQNKEKGDVCAGESKYLDQNLEAQNGCKCCENCIGHSQKHFAEPSRTTDDGCCSHKTQYGDNKRHQRIQEPSRCKCCEDCPGHQNLKVEEKKHHENATCDDYERRKSNSILYSKYRANVVKENPCDCENCTGQDNYYPLRYSGNEYRHEEEESEFSRECQCCDDCPGKTDEEMKPQTSKSRMLSTCPDADEEAVSERSSEIMESPPVTEKRKSTDATDEKKGKNHNRKYKNEKYKKESPPRLRRKSPSLLRPTQPRRSSKSKGIKGSPEEGKDKNKDSDYYNFNKKEYLTKSELEREEKKKKPARLTLQECLTVKRPDLYTRAECRRKIITEKSRDRAERHNKGIACLAKCLTRCENPGNNADMKLFTSAQMRKQTKKFYKKLPEVTNKVAEEKKKMQFRTNKLMAEIFAKKLQLQTLKGCLNLSNSFTVMSTM